MPTRRRRRNLRHLSDEELACALSDPDLEHDARNEALRRFQPLADRLAQRYCSKLYHRGAKCRGAYQCDGPVGVAKAVVLERIVGRPAEGRRRGVKGQLERWPDRRKSELDVQPFILANCGGWESDARRQWNRERGLPARARLTRAERPAAEAAYAEYLDSPPALAVRAAGAALPGLISEWVDALYNDACDTGLSERIDIERVGRAVCITSLDPGLRATIVIDVDHLLARYAPVLWGQLERARDLTRQLSADRSLPGADDDRRKGRP